MRYSNPEVDHKVNVDQPSEFKMFGSLIIGVPILLLTIFCLIYLFFGRIAPFIPFHYETMLIQNAVPWVYPANTNPQYKAAEAAIQQLADQLAQTMNLPKDIHIRVILTDQNEQNAFATLGGLILITQGTINLVSSENALAMVVGHEIGHIKQRDPLISGGSSLMFNLVLTMITGGHHGVLELSSSYLMQLSFSRQQENTADDLGLQAVQKYYGHLQGTQEFFEAMATQDTGSEFFKTHPQTRNRLEKIYQEQIKTPGTLTPLAPEIKAIQSGTKI